MKRQNARKEKKKERASRRKEKSTVKIEITEMCGGIKKRKKEKEKKCLDEKKKIKEKIK